MQKATEKQMSFEKYVNKVISGDSLEVLKDFPSNFINLIITSPPYFGARLYGDEILGREEDPLEYIDHLFEFTKEFKKDLETLILFENSRVYVLENNIVPPMVAVTDTMVLTCFSCGTSLNGSNNLISFGDEAVKWGLEIFEYFRALAKPLVPELMNQGDTKSEN